MNIAKPFIERPIATSLLSLALLLAGAGAYRLLPVAPLPQVEFPVIQVQAMLPGARRALRDGASASAGDREDLEDLRATVSDLDTMMNDSPTFQLMRDRDGA